MLFFDKYKGVNTPSGNKSEGDDTPNVLTYKFHDFRPSDRIALKDVARAEGGEDVFLAALEIYLRKWANAEWLNEYKIERIAVWAGAHLPKSLLGKMHAKFSRERDGAQTENAKKTYSVMANAVEKELATLRASSAFTQSEARI